jgi:hypothetical protein
LEYFKAVWNILWRFDRCYGQLAILWLIGIFNRFGILYQEALKVQNLYFIPRLVYKRVNNIRFSIFGKILKIGPRVTSLGKFSPIRVLFTVGSFSKITEVEKNYVPLFSVVKVTYVLILTKKTGWATFWAILLQTHLVTLIGPEAIKYLFRARKRSL